MDTSQIKKFAVQARNVLKQGVIEKMSLFGFDEQGQVEDRYRPQLLQGGTLFMGQIYDESFYAKWTTLQQRIQHHGLKEVYEEAAYCWFNRLMAIRIMQKNGFIEPVLSYDDDEFRIPHIVAAARNGQVGAMSQTERKQLDELLIDDGKTAEQFALLIVAYCNSNAVIKHCFGGISEYTELLLPNNMLSSGGFIDLLNHTDFISDEDFRKVELIGWLYQFYISEKKDEVFASFKKGKKAEAEDIPAATQIFTPNWIVKYMVQNTVGRIYLDNNPSCDLGQGWKYLVEPSQPTPAENIFRYSDLTELTMADLGCGSGHILNEGFDIFYQLYLDEGYSRRQAIENIFRHNLTGVDIDTRAKQLATFALLLKACQKDDSFLDCHTMPHVLDMPAVNLYTYRETVGHFTTAYSLPNPDKEQTKELERCFELMQQADNLGSIMKFHISSGTRKLIQQYVEAFEGEPRYQDALVPFIHGLQVILTLTQKYASMVMNPPYMGSGNMNADLSAYVQQHYPAGKADLCTAMMIMQADNTAKNGFYANIIPPSWMFLSSFESLRRKIIDDNSIQSLLHLSRGVFGADFGSVSCVIKNTKYKDATGTYFRLIERTFQEFDQQHLQQLFEKTLSNHDFKYYFADYSKEIASIEYSESGAKIYYPNVPQKNFEKIPGCPLGYWLSSSMVNLFTKNQSMDKVSKPSQGIATADNNRFVRYWFEVSSHNMYLGAKNAEEAAKSCRKWFPYNKGGDQRRWYGNQTYLIDWKNDGYSIKHFFNDKGKQRSVIRNPKQFFKPSISWSDISSNGTSYKVYPNGFLFDVCGMSCFDAPSPISLLGVLNSKAISGLSKVLNPTMHFQIGDFCKLPYIHIDSASFESIVLLSIWVSRQDWDSHETSWDFLTNELVRISRGITEAPGQSSIEAEQTHLRCDSEHILDASASSLLKTELSRLLRQNLSSIEPLADLYQQYKAYWQDKFMQLHANEEELNRQFIHIYGLEDELTPDVPLDEITILQQGEISINNGQIEWHADVVMKQLLSYAVGCMMGRYRLDEPGLWIAHPNPTDDEICTYQFNGFDYTIDDDGIMPLMNGECGFDDNAKLRVDEFIRVAFGSEHQAENLNFIEQCLGKSIEDYLKKDFWKDHKKMYQNRPIYWLFSSKKGAFQVLAYMHRMNPYTVEQIRNKYLLPHIQFLQDRIADLEQNAATLTTTDRRKLERLRADLLECQEYHERLHQVADQQIAFDLDDGVIVNHAKFGDVVAKIK